MTRKNLDKLVMTLVVAILVSMGAARVASAQILKVPVFPRPVYFGNYVSGITAGFAHTCVNRFDGSVYCWGLNGNGQIGITSTANCIQAPNYNTPYPCVDRPQLVVGNGMSQIAAGDNHTCAMSPSGVVNCWGSGGSGQGGNDYNDHPAPQVVATNFAFSSIAAGGNTSCGISSGQIVCWGDAPKGSFIGVPKTPNVVPAWSGASFQSVAVGYQFLCGLNATGGGWFDDDCIGADARGQLGADPTASWMPKDSFGLAFAKFWLFGSMNNGFSAPGNTRVAAGRDFSCVDHSDGTVQCVGANQAGQLGIGFTSFASKPYEWSTIRVGGAQGAAQLHGVVAGWSHACALDASGHAFCWGNGEYGQLGNGSGSGGSGNYYATTPQMVVDTTGAAPTFRALAAGALHTCGIGTDNYIYCWGDNTFGQVGVGLNNLGMRPSGFGYATFTPKAVRTAGL
jgi:alpha-tubulin suppressor-like RCC1 family protein